MVIYDNDGNNNNNNYCCIDVFFVSSGGGHFFNRNSMSPRSVACEMELPDIQASLDLYDDNKS